MLVNRVGQPSWPSRPHSPSTSLRICTLALDSSIHAGQTRSLIATFCLAFMAAVTGCTDTFSTSRGLDAKRLYLGAAARQFRQLQKGISRADFERRIHICRGKRT
uniref:Uncharacterized protein n=1 Tax=Amorphochlora amoebiformis TaxID=1561963 RepID=A0A7S0D9T4_9EUKA